MFELSLIVDELIFSILRAIEDRGAPWHVRSDADLKNSAVREILVRGIEAAESRIPKNEGVVLRPSYVEEFSHFRLDGSGGVASCDAKLCLGTLAFLRWLDGRLL